MEEVEKDISNIKKNDKEMRRKLKLEDRERRQKAKEIKKINKEKTNEDKLIRKGAKELKRQEKEIRRANKEKKNGEIEDKYRFKYVNEKTIKMLRKKNIQKKFYGNKPFPHIAIDNFLKEDVAEKILELFPQNTEEARKKLVRIFNHKNKYVYNIKKADKFIKSVIDELVSSEFNELLKNMMDENSLIARIDNPGNGIHDIKNGGFLGVHTDHNMYKSGVDNNYYDRRLNLLLYLNKDWKEEYGGDIQLWSHEDRTCKKKILPIFNRCLLFPTYSESYHGHPEPLNCPENMSRKSIALYFYSKNDVNGDYDFEGLKYHSTFYIDSNEGNCDGAGDTAIFDKGGRNLTDKIDNYIVNREKYDNYHKKIKSWRK